MVKPKASRFARLRRGRHGVVSSPQLRLDGCVYPDTAMTRPIGALADRTWLAACGFRRW
jgi:hypothetical protein